MRRLLCLLAVALLAAAPVHSRQLKFDFPSPSPAPSPSQPKAPTDACVTAYNAVVDGDTGACRDGEKLSDCCAALSGLGKTCLESVYDFMKATPEDNAKAFAFLESLLEQCSAPSPSPGPSPSPSPSPSNGPTQQCIDSFNAMVDSAVCGKGSSPEKCCAAFAALGTCLDDIVAAMEQERAKYADTLAAIEATRKQCGDGPTPSPIPSPNPLEPSEQCVADFNAAMKGSCGQGSTVSMCCSAVKGLGSCLDDIMAAMAQKAEYADALKQLEALVQQCGFGPTPSPSPGPGPGPTPDLEKCVEGLMATFDVGGACAGSSATACCDSLDSLGKDCLESFLAYTKQENMTVHDAFVALLQSCGWTISSSNSGTRAAPEVTATAMARLQEVGAAKQAVAPQAARRALIQSTVRRYEKLTPKVERSAASQALLVKA